MGFESRAEAACADRPPDAVRQVAGLGGVHGARTAGLARWMRVHRRGRLLMVELADDCQCPGDVFGRR